MTPKSDLEIRGNFLTHPFAEVIAEIAHARLSGSLRVVNKAKKSVVYFREGRIVFAASNARASRLFEILISKGKISKADLADVPDLTNDLELAAFLQDKRLLTKTDVERTFAEQVKGIVADVLSWNDGEWVFSALARARDGLDFEVKTADLLVDHARTLETDEVLKRFRSMDEKFERSELPMNGLALTQNEAFVLSRAEHEALTATDLANVAAMPHADALHVLYSMWLAGLLERTEWQPAFGDETVRFMRSAKLELKKEAKMPKPIVQKPAEIDQTPVPERPEPTKESEITLTIDEYLDRVENAATYYDILGVDPEAETAEIKRAYFSLAKMFHPDKYHSGGSELRRRVQNAFTEMSQAHETLKDESSRDVYDYKMRKEITVRQQAAASGETVTVSHQLMQAGEHFERGFSLLMDDEVDAALPFLARAVHYAPKNARYHAYYGKALASEGQHRHKAESEMQTAVKIDPDNPTFRMLLAEFFVQMGLKKRAEGELNRLLAIFPSNLEARDLLATLK